MDPSLTSPQTPLADLVVGRGLVSRERLAELDAAGDDTALAEQLVASGILASEEAAGLLAEVARPEDEPRSQAEAPTESRAREEGSSRLDTATSEPGRGGPGGASEEEDLLPAGSAVQLGPDVELRVERALGQGGMGVVYLVRDPRLDRLAALKLVRGAPTEVRLRRFRREAAITARLAHPGIPPVYDAGRSQDGREYMLLSYVEGESLADLLERHERRQAHQRRMNRPPLPPPRELLDALVKVGEALAYAHDRGIVHRDLKPSNIMVGSFGQVFVMDWGLARDFRESAQSDSTFWELVRPGPADDNALLGTLGYMAPEQARREPVDARADVFALGAILTEVLSGRAPVDGQDPAEVLTRTRTGDVEGPAARGRPVPRELDALARHALAYAPEQRYEDAGGFTEDLRAYLRGGAVSVYRYGIGERVLQLLRAHPTAAVAVAVLLLTLATMVGVRRAVRAEEVRTARLEAVRLRRELQREPSSRLPERLGQAWAALEAAQRWHERAPESSAAARAVFRSAFVLGDIARNGNQWALARQAYLEASELGVDDARARRAVRRIEDAQRALEEHRRAQVQSWLDRVAESEAAPRPAELREAVEEIVRHEDGARTVRVLVARLDALTADLAAVQRRAHLEATPAGRAEEVRRALRTREELGPGAPLPAPLADALEAARAELESGAAGATWLEVVAARQASRIEEGRLALGWVLSEALGRLRHRAAAPALLRYLTAEADGRRAAAAGGALCRLGRQDAALAAAERRFAGSPAFRGAVERALERDGESEGE